jgi:hypothetical protein
MFFGRKLSQITAFQRLQLKIRLEKVSFGPAFPKYHAGQLVKSISRLTFRGLPDTIDLFGLRVCDSLK